MEIEVGHPREGRDRGEPTFARFLQVCRRFPERPALFYLGTTFTFGELGDGAARLATALHRLGVGHGDRVMLYLANCPQWVIANFAVQRLGAVVVPVSPIYTAHELRFMVEHAGVETLICQDTNFGYAHRVLSESSLRRLIVTNLTERLPLWKRALGHLLDRIPTGRVTYNPDVFSFGRLLDSTAPDPPEVDIDPWRDLASILYTGGTTASPKAVAGHHMSEVGYLRDVMEEVVRPAVRPEEDRLALMLPLYHIMAKGFFLALGIGFGIPTVLLPVPQTDALMAAIDRRRVSWLLGVPTLYRRILENERLDRYRLRSLHSCFCGGDVLPGEVFRRWRERTGVAIRQVYGSTEVGHVAYGRAGGDRDPKTIGPPLPSYRCRVVDPETLEPVAAGEVGELMVTAAFTPTAYWNAPRETARAFVEVAGEVFYRTGDFVTLGDDGEIRFVERTADIIKHKGLRVSASEVEAVLQDHPKVVGACVVGVDDPEVGERIKAFVVLREGVRGVSGTDLRRWCRERLAAHKVPSTLEFRDMLPKSKVGKLLRRELRGPGILADRSPPDPGGLDR